MQCTLVFPSPTYSKAVSSGPAPGGWEVLEEPAASPEASPCSLEPAGSHLFQQGGGVAKGSSALMLVLGGESCPSIWGQMSPSTACNSYDLL